MEIQLAFRAPYRWDAIARFLAARETFVDGRYVRDGVTIDSSLRMTVERGEREDVVARAERTFDLASDPAPIDQHLRRDRNLPWMAGTRVPGAWEPFEVAVRAIVGQQISVAGATTIVNRIRQHFRRFPSPSELASSRKNFGMPEARARAIRSMAREVCSDPTLLQRGPTLEESIARLTSLRGVGPWTAHYIAMRALAEPDAFPDGDLGLRKAAERAGIRNLAVHAERWRPYRAYAAMALWESLG